MGEGLVLPAPLPRRQARRAAPLLLLHLTEYRRTEFCAQLFIKQLSQARKVGQTSS